MYLHLFQNRTIPEILQAEGYQEILSEEANKPHKAEKSKKADKNKEKQKIDEDTLKAIKEEQDKVDKENRQKRREILKAVHLRECALHQERVDTLWNDFTSILLKQYSQAQEFGAIESSKVTPEIKEILNSLNNIRYIWKIFNRMVEDALAIKHL